MNLDILDLAANQVQAAIQALAATQAILEVAYQVTLVIAVTLVKLARKVSAVTQEFQVIAVSQGLAVKTVAVAHKDFGVRFMTPQIKLRPIPQLLMR